MRKPTPEEKTMLSPREAIAFYGLNYRNFYNLLREEEKLPFLMFYKKRKLIVKSKFERFLQDNPYLRGGQKR